MRQWFFLVVMVFFMLSASTLYAQTGTVTVTVTGIDAEKSGRVNIGIYNANGFPTVGKQLHGIDLDVKGTSATYEFKDIPVGKYAIAVFQDENSDGKLNTNLFGAPRNLTASLKTNSGCSALLILRTFLSRWPERVPSH